MARSDRRPPWSRSAAGGLSDKRWLAGSMPVMGSSFRLRWEMVHEGVMRRSDVAEGLVMRSGMSRVGGGIFVFWRKREARGQISC